MITVIVIPVDPGQPIRLQQLEPSDVDAYQQIVGGNLQIVGLDRPSAAMYLNEEGKLNRMRVNHRATTLMWVHNSAFRNRDVIVGPALIVGPPNRHGNDTSAPEDLTDLLFNTKRYRVQLWTGSDPRWVSDAEVFIDWQEAYRYALQLVETREAAQEVRVVPELDNELREQWFKLGVENPWISSADDPPFTEHSFVGCYSIEELEERIGHGNWSIGTAFYYRDLCFINQVDGGDEWLTIRHGIAFESMTLEPSIEEGKFARLIHRLLTATKAQCQALTY
ncbi:DUF3846 domain-containing protein [Streptomyces lunaelactis]|uniref:DUF3846 domain-containing protein n=1 Tax=Streptomyces lunaelactis TaxID=1535768 RepID=UPI001585286D|nr:DUF3846 domain-containing protein [Streptomyces lunaelactis]NUL28437.1 DUF3846 domain-containing protein [Streptomyces lunaelactis]